jgi:VCBS repeat-containing protein
LNFVGKFDGSLPVDGPGAHAHVETFSQHATHAPAGAIIIPDAQLLFNGAFTRSGVDLVLSKDDHELVLHDYFKGEKRAALSSPDGAHLTGDLVNALTGHVEYAQADGNPGASHVIGHVSKLTGSGTAVRNGVSIILNNGDNVEKGDVVQAGSDSALGITFIDGTVFGLSSNARMVLNEMVYDPNGSNNSSLLSLVAGTISFVAGETAKHGDMKIDTPVATMGIRGTAGLVEIDFDVSITATPNAPATNTHFQVLVEPDGTTGSYILFDKTTLTPIATVNQAGQQVNISQGNVSITNSPLTDAQQKLITDVFAQKFTDNTNSNTKTASSTGSSTPDNQQIQIAHQGDDSNKTGTATVTVTVTASNGPGSGPPVDPNAHVPGGPTVIAGGGAVTEIPGTTNDKIDKDAISGPIFFADINPGDRPTVTIDPLVTFTYKDAQGHDVTAQVNANAQWLADVKAVEVDLNSNLTPDSGNKNGGFYTWHYSVTDGAFDFLAAGEKLTLTYVAHVNNNFALNPEITNQSFTITITGTNDVPVITTAAESVAFSGGKTTPGGNLPTIGGALTTGTLAFTDVDLTDTHTVSTALTNASLSGLPGSELPARTLDEAALDALAPTPMAKFEQALSAIVASDSTGTGSGTINWTLADLPVWVADFINPGETLTLTYTVTVTDSQNKTATQNVVVTIDGTASAAVVWIDTKPAPASGALWSDASNWETGTVPTATDDAIIITNQLNPLTPTSPVLTPTYPVLINAAAFAQSLTMNDFSDLTDPHHPQPRLVNQNTLTIGTGGISLSADSKIENFGTIDVGGAMELLDSSVLHNAGILNLAQGGDFKTTHTVANDAAGTIDVTGGTLNVKVAVTNDGTLEATGLGGIVLNNAKVTNETVTDPVTQEITSTGAVDVVGSGATLNLESATISGGIVDNSGTLEATSGTSTISGVTTFTNSATLEVINNSTLVLGSETVSNSGTVKVVGSGATLNLESATISGGIVNNSGTLGATSGTSTIKNTSSFTNSGTLETFGAELDLVNTVVTNTGSVIVDVLHSANGTLNLQNATIKGGAVSTFAAFDLIEATSSVNFINNATSITNAGTIEANGGTLTIDTAGTFSNAGTLEAIGGSTLNLISTTVTNAATGVTTAGAGSHINLQGASLLQHTVSTAALGEIDTVSGTSNTINTANGAVDLSGRVNNAGTIAIADNSSLRLISAAYINNTGTIELNSTGDNTYLYIDQGYAGFDGGGHVTLSDDTHNIIAALASGDQLTNNNNTISGAGDIGQGGLVLVNNNNGVIDANGQNTLKLDPLSLTNTGTLEASNGATLLINTTVTNYTGSGNTLVNGIVAATGTNLSGTSHSSVGLQSAEIDGGNISITAQGAMVATSGINTINGAASITNSAGTLEANGAELDLINSSVTNQSSVINGNSINGIVYVTGTNGTIKLETASISGGEVYTTGASDTIEATSGINAIDNAARISNAGTIEANGGQLTIDSAGNFTNTGTLAAINSSTLVLYGETVTNAVTDPTTHATRNGTVQVTGSGSTLDLQGATISGGILTNSGKVDSSGNSFLTNVAITNSGTIEAISEILIIDPATQLPIANSGTLEANGGELDLTGETVTNTGTLQAITSGSTLKLTDTTVNNNDGVAGDRIGTVTAGSGATLDLVRAMINGGTIGGAGTITTATGNTDSTLSGVTVNSGTTVTAAVGTLDLTGTIANSGTFLASGGTIDLENATITGGILGGAGTIATVGANTESTLSGVTIASGTKVTASAGTTLDLTGSIANGGEIDAAASGGTIDLENASITGGTLGGTGTIATVGANSESTLSGVTIASGTKVTASANTTLDLTGSITNHGETDAAASGGTIDLENAAITGGTLGGGGTIATADTNTDSTLSGVTIASGTTVTAAVGVLDLTGSIANSGTFLASGGTIDLEGATITGGTLGGTGTIDVVSSSKIQGTPTVNAILSTGNVTVESGQTLQLDNVTVTGTTFTDPGTIKVDSGNNTLTLAGTDTITGGQFAIGQGKVALVNGGGIRLSGVSIGNLKATDPDPQVKLTISAPNASNLTIAGGINEPDGTVQITGTLAEINAALAIGLTYDPSITPTVLTMTIVDSLGDTAFRSVTITPTGSPTLQVTDASGAIRNGNVIDIVSGATVTLSSDEVFNGSGNLKVEANALLKLIHTGTHGGTITDDGTIEITGQSGLNGGSLNIDVNGFLTVDSAELLTLNKMTVTGGTVTDGGTIEIIGSSAINGAHLNYGGVTVDSGQTLTLDGTTVAGTTITGTDATSIVHVDDGQTLTLNGATISGGTLTIDGTLVSTGTSAISNAINGATINNAGTLESTGGTLTIDSASTVNNTGLLEANGGSLIVGVGFSGSAEIFGASLLALGADSTVASPDPYGLANISFATTSSGTLELDHAKAFHGTISGLDDNTLDLRDIAYGTSTTTVNYVGTAAAGILHVFESGVDVADIKLSGDYRGVHWALASDGSSNGTVVTEVPGAITSGLDASGNASEGSAVSVSITDGGKLATNPTYDWQIYDSVHGWIEGSGTGGASATYTPGEGDEGHALRVSIGFTDANGNNDTLYKVSAGTVLDAAPTVTTPTISGTAQEGATLTASASAGQSDNTVSYQWQTSTDGGASYHDIVGATGSTYLVKEVDESNKIDVVATTTNDNGVKISATSAATATVTDDTASVSAPSISGSAIEGHVLTASATANDTDATVTYQWFSSADGFTAAIGTGATYTVAEGDENHTLKAVATATDVTGGTLASATSAATAIVTDDTASVSAPSISGSAIEGHVLTASATANDTDATVTYQWFSSADGFTAAIGSGATYTVAEGDESHTLKAVATATDATGGTLVSATSAATATVTDDIASVSAPSISGSAIDGQVLTASATATDTDATVTYQWFSSADGFTAAIGSGATYTVQETDENHTLKAVATATDVTGGTLVSATSAATATVPDDAPVIGATSIVTGSVTEAGALALIAEAGAGGPLHVAAALSGNATVVSALGTLDGHLAGLPTASDVQAAVTAIAGAGVSDTATAIAVVWQHLDSIYASGSNQTNINAAFTELGLEYAAYLQAGGSPLVDVVAKYAADNDNDGIAERVQSLHDNLLGNLTDYALHQRYDAAGLYTQMHAMVSAQDATLLTRTAVGGYDTDVPGSAAAAHAYDLQHGYAAHVSGQLTATDVDTNDAGHLTWTVAGTSAYGTMSIDASTGQWTYTLDDSLAATEALGAGDTVTQSFVATVTDGHGGSANQTVTMTIHGTADTPVIGADLAPSITGSLSIVVVKGGSGQLTTTSGASLATLQAVDPDNTPDQLTFTVTGTSHGHVASSANGPAITSFTQAQINSGSVYFVADSTNPDGTPYVGQGSFTVSLSDGVSGTPTATTTVGTTMVDAQLNVLTTSDFDFNQDDPISAMGSGTVSGATSTSFTISNVAANRDFTFTGTGFVYDSVHGVFTAGTITSILETTDDSGHAQLASFLLNVSVVDWMNAAIAKANGDHSLIETMTKAWTFNFVGNNGSDAFDSGDQNDIFTGRAGDDTLSGEFGYDRANYGNASAGITVHLADNASHTGGSVTGDGSVGTDTLQSIELVTGSNFADTYDATGFSATSSNAGSTVTSNTAGMFNEFEGRGGNDIITGNGTTRVSYFHATSGVTVTFDGNSWNPAFNPNGGASGTATGDASTGTDTFTGVYNVRGSNFNDVFHGSNNPSGTTEEFEGAGGNDLIDGGGGFDRADYSLVHDGIGIDVELAAGTVTDRAGGTDAGHDTLLSVEAVWGSAFADIYNAVGFSQSSTNAGNFTTFNEFEGDAGNDSITGNGNTRVAYYHATGGVVVTLGSSGSGTADGNSSVGHDTFVSGVNAVRGSEFNDIITGNSSNNILDGRGGNDVLDSGGFNGTLTGGTGSDIFVYKPGYGVTTITDFSHASGDRIDLRAFTGIHGINDLTFSVSGSTLTITSAAYFSGSIHNIVIQGYDAVNNPVTASDFIFNVAGGSSVAITVQTPDGYDFSTLYDDMAASSLVPAADTSTHMFAVDAAKGITFELVGTGFTYNATSHQPITGTITEIDILNTTDPTQTTQDHVLANTNGWNIAAASLFNAIATYHTSQATAGLDAIFNAATYDIVGSNGISAADNHSGSGADVLVGGDHPDVFNGSPGPFSSGDDTVDYSHATTGLTADLQHPANNTHAAAGDTYISIENLRGTAFDDILTGDGNNNVLEGGLGNNIFNGGGGNDTASYAHATAGVTVSLAVATPQNTIGAGTDTLNNISNLTGSHFNDTLTGDSHDNVLSGNGGNDILFGGGGNDTFVFNAAMGHGTINDFTSGQDHIQLNLAVPFSSGNEASFQSWATTSSHVAQVGADTLITFDAADTILLKNVNIANLHASDFILPNHG